MTFPSATAGKACLDCGIPDPCILEVISDFPENKEVHRWSKEGVMHFTLLDSGPGCHGTITVQYYCDKSGEHEAWLAEASAIKRTTLTAFGTPNAVTLHYKGEKDDTDLMGVFRTPWEYLSAITSPFDVFDEPARYTVEIDSCYECGRYVGIDVYPTLEMRFTTGLSYDLLSTRQARTIKERRDERSKARAAMENTKPKNKNKLRSGWQNATAEFELVHKTSLNVEFGLKVAGVDYSHTYEEEIKKFRHIKRLEQMGRIDALMKNINQYFAPDPENQGSTRQYSLFSAEIKPVQIGVSYAYQYIDINDGPCHFYGLYGSPFFEGTLKFDIISFICAYCRIETLVNRCREYLSKHGTSVECYIEISAGVNLDLGACYAVDEASWDFAIQNSQLYLGLKGVVSATFEAEVFVVELTAQANASIEAKAGFGFDQHDDGLDLALYHDGIKGTFEFNFDYSHSEKKGGGKIVSPIKESKTKHEWQLCEPLDMKKSPLRINLYGKINLVSKPKLTPPKNGVPWAMGSNPDWDNRIGNNPDYNGIPHFQR